MGKTGGLSTAEDTEFANKSTGEGKYLFRQRQNLPETPLPQVSPIKTRVH